MSVSTLSDSFVLLRFHADQVIMGSACSKPEVVEEPEPLPSLLRSGSPRFPGEVNVSGPLNQNDGLVTADRERGTRSHHSNSLIMQFSKRQEIHEQQQCTTKEPGASGPLVQVFEDSLLKRRDGTNSQVSKSRINNLPRHIEGEQIAAGWPPWLSAVAGEAIQGWVPRRADSFEKLDKVSIRFVVCMPGNIAILKLRLDKGHVASYIRPGTWRISRSLPSKRMSSHLYLVFEYMGHDLAGLADSPEITFTEPQIKCLFHQLLSGLEYCHTRGVLHRDIKGSNLLLDNSGILKIADFGHATFFCPDQNQPLTSRVVTLWYRSPELLLGASEYGVGIDLWSSGCFVAELFAGKPIMPGRTEVDQLHKIFRLCGSPSEDYWKKTKLPFATIFMPQQPYKRSIVETFVDFPPSALALLDKLLAIEPENRATASAALNSQFFTTKPYACDPSSLPFCQPSKETDAKFREEENRRQRNLAEKAHGP